jgi:hypothetical protein
LPEVVKAVAFVPPLAMARVPPRVNVPAPVIGPPERVNPVVPPEPETDVTVPLPPAIHVPLIAKHPPVRVRPFAKVEEAEVEVTSMALVCIPPPKVEVPAPETIKLVVVAVPVTAKFVEVAFVKIESTAFRMAV